MNCLAVADVFEQHGVSAKVQTALSIDSVAEPFNIEKTDRYLKDGCVVLFGCGTGSPFFSTDTASVLRAVEIGADVVLLAKNIDGVYSADPKKDPNARKFDRISHEEVLIKQLTVIDLTATALALDNKMSILLFDLREPENIIRIMSGENIGTVID
jgi:uridylate kinase